MNLAKSFHYGIHNNKLESHLKSQLARIGENAKLDVDLSISRNLTDPGVILDEASAEVDLLKEEVQKDLNPEIDKMTEEINQTNIEALQNVTAVQEVELNKQMGRVEVDIKRTKLSYDWSMYKWYVLAIIILCSIDALANYSSLQILVKILLLAIIFAMVIAGGLSYASHVLGSKIQSSTTVLKKCLWFIGGLLSAGIAFYMLGSLRYSYMANSGLTTFSPFLWMLFNDFFFCIALLLASTKLPTKEQFLEHRNLQELKKQWMSLKNNREKLLSDLQRKEEQINECKQKREAFWTYRDELIIFLEKAKEHLHAMCKKEFAIKSGQAPIEILSISKGSEK